MVIRSAATPVVGFLLAIAHAVSSADEPDLTMLVGQKVDLQLQAGKSVSGGEVTKVTPGSEPGSIRSLAVKSGKPARTQTIAANLIIEIYQDGQPLDVDYDKKKRTLAHNSEKRAARLKHAAEVEQRLAAQRHHLWADLSEKEHEDWIGKHKAFLKDVSDKMPGVAFQLVETKYYLFYTDMPLETVGVYIAYLDSMYEELCKAFGIPPGKNIWCGKCVIVAFQGQDAFQMFESRIYQNPGLGAQGLHHGSYDGKVVISCWKGDQDVFFAKVLVHETAHGFIHRWMSTVHVPSWVNEGVADWVAAMVVKDKSVPQRQKDAVERIRQTGSLGGGFFDETRNIDAWQYGVASSLVELLLRLDANKYRQFLTGIKEGLPSEESLQKAYGLTKEQLIVRYGALAGVPNLQP